MRSERTANALAVGVVSELILRSGLRVDSFNRLGTERKQRVPVRFATHHRRGEFLPLLLVGTALPIQKTPEAADVLLQLPEDKIGAVSAEVPFASRVFGKGQHPTCGRAVAQQWTVCVFRVFVWIPKQKFAERKQVAILDLITLGHALAFPVERRLTDAVLESERLGALQVRRRQAFEHLKGGVPRWVADRLLERFEPARLRVEHDEHMGDLPGRPPLPVLRRVCADIPKPARATFLPSHAGKKLIGKTSHNALFDSQRLQAFAREGHLQRRPGWVGQLFCGREKSS